MSLLFASALLAALSLAHPGSVSSSRVRVDGEGLSVVLRVQPTSLLEVLPALDSDGHGGLAAPEVRAARDVIGRYLLAHVRVAALDDTREQPLALELVRVEPLPPKAGLAPNGEPWVEVALAGRAGAPIEALALTFDAFFEVSLDHRSFCEVRWSGPAGAEVVQAFVFDAFAPRAEFRPAGARRRGLGSWVRLGVEHILGGYDHLAFVLALLVGTATLGALVRVVTAFTLAHSLTLALAALGLVELSPRLVELAIALSIAFVGAQSLLDREPRSLALEAFGFGLVHGLGFAGFLGQALSETEQRLVPLAGFNVGVEIGQLVVVVLALALLAPLHRRRRRRLGPRERPRLVPAPLVAPLALAVTAMGLVWFGQRAGWL